MHMHQSLYLVTLPSFAQHTSLLLCTTPLGLTSQLAYLVDKGESWSQEKEVSHQVSQRENCNPAKLQLVWQEAEGKNTMCLSCPKDKEAPGHAWSQRSISWGMEQERCGEDSW